MDNHVKTSPPDLRALRRRIALVLTGLTLVAAAGLTAAQVRRIGDWRVDDAYITFVF